MKDQLYLLRPGFMNAGMGAYCSDSAPWKRSELFPQLRKLVDIHYLEFPRPREPLVKALGDQYQSLPYSFSQPIEARRTATEQCEWQMVFADQSSIPTICRRNTICASERIS